MVVMVVMVATAWRRRRWRDGGGGLGEGGGAVDGAVGRADGVAFGGAVDGSWVARPQKHTPIPHFAVAHSYPISPLIGILAGYHGKGVGRGWGERRALLQRMARAGPAGPVARRTSEGNSPKGAAASERADTVRRQRTQPPSPGASKSSSPADYVCLARPTLCLPP